MNTEELKRFVALEQRQLQLEAEVDQVKAGGRLAPERAQRAKDYAAKIEPFLKAAPAMPLAHDVSEAAEGEVV
ncbi:MAG: hypothetical protein KIT09_31815 [Bryobacteraceae bacterium]|nr:hypothetical protein [Bryobacteraceae bacterium]